jgi:hypothetical protein
MVSKLNLPLADPISKSLEIHIEAEDGFESGVLQLQNVSVFKTPSGTILIYAHEN